MLELNLSNILVILFYVLPFLVMAHKPFVKAASLSIFKATMKNGGSVPMVVWVIVLTSLGLQVLTFVANWPLALALTIFSMGITPLFSNMYRDINREVIGEIETLYSRSN